MKYTIRNTKKFDKDLIKCNKRGLPIKKIYEGSDNSTRNRILPDEYRPHKLHGKYEGLWECHLNGRNSDWVMIWDQNDFELTLLMLRTGSHSDLL